MPSPASRSMAIPMGAVKTRRPRKLKTKAGKPDRRREGIKASWDKTRKVAEKLGRTDLMNVRSEIVAGKHKDV